MLKELLSLRTPLDIALLYYFSSPDRWARYII